MITEKDYERADHAREQQKDRDVWDQVTQRTNWIQDVREVAQSVGLSFEQRSSTMARIGGEPGTPWLSCSKERQFAWCSGAGFTPVAIANGLCAAAKLLQERGWIEA